MASEKGTPYVFQLSPLMELGFHLINGLSVWASLLFAQIINGWTLTTHPLQTICILWLFESPIVILGFSLLSKKLEHCSLKWAILRGLLGLPAGALVNAFGAIVFGAPVGIKFLTRTVNWALLMSLLTVVPTASVYGSSWKDWQRLYAHSNLSTSTWSCYWGMVWSLAHATRLGQTLAGVANLCDLWGHNWTYTWNGSIFHSHSLA
ncbi:uncharacterized protein LOC18422713 isoform X13 [Amborella trichopoda]|uniref:uncharacterized protein LOC18422713 isoform X13 n=1 Tax=Amborella trichopoda TaxID=13333 RepID=UPI0009BF3BBF|nr:uncharacterized protein LOC18422713 isoform X13 [Amborella trichopoda]|eukprot:XP_020523388.1 uncharacterized protein LOC18422713 isoform X13 [Amborella trichopoda]